MPELGITNRQESADRLGWIKKGAPKPEKGPGKDLNYFRVVFAPGKDKNALEQRFLEVYGKNPVEINVRFPQPAVSDVWDVNRECYKQGGLYAKSGQRADGSRYWIFYRDPETSEVLIHSGAKNQPGYPAGQAGRDFMEIPIDIEKPIYYLSDQTPVLLKPLGRLQVVIPELASISVGYFEFAPTSPRDMGNISAELGYFAQIASTYGKTICGIPFHLIRREEIVPKKINGKLQHGPSWVVHLKAGGAWGQRALEAMDRLALEVIDIEAEDVEDDTFEHPPEEEVKNEPQPVPALPAPKAAARVNDPQIDPTGEAAIGYAAQQWDKSPDDAKKLIAANPKFTNPMSKGAFKKLVAGEVWP